MAEYQENKEITGFMFILYMWDKTKKEYLENGFISSHYFVLAINKGDDVERIFGAELPDTKHLNGIKYIAEQFKINAIIDYVHHKMLEEGYEPFVSFRAETMLNKDGDEQIITRSKMGDYDELVTTYNIVINETKVNDKGEIMSEIEFAEI